MSPRKYQSPLQAQHLDGINAALKIGSQLQPFLDDCRACGIPVDEQQQRLDALLQTAKAIKATFFPLEP